MLNAFRYQLSASRNPPLFVSWKRVRFVRVCGELLKALSVTFSGETKLQKRLFVGGLPYSTKEDEIRDLFAQAGEVVSANIIRDRFTEQSRGFGFVEMATEEQAAEAIKLLNGTQLGGRSIVVNESRPQEKKSFDRAGGGDKEGGFRKRRESRW